MTFPLNELPLLAHKIIYSTDTLEKEQFLGIFRENWGSLASFSLFAGGLVRIDCSSEAELYQLPKGVKFAAHLVMVGSRVVKDKTPLGASNYDL